MPLFVCDDCGCVDNTATSDFYRQAQEGSPKRLCTFCRTGTWHDRFPREPQNSRKVIWPTSVTPLDR